jgi:hypothetical protein
METLLQIFPKYTPHNFCHLLVLYGYLYYHNTRMLRNTFKIHENLK